MMSPECLTVSAGMCCERFVLCISRKAGMHYGKYFTNGNWAGPTKASQSCGSSVQKKKKSFLSISSRFLNHNKYSKTTSLDPHRPFNFTGFSGSMINMVSQMNKISLLDQLLLLAYAYVGSVEVIGIAFRIQERYLALFSNTSNFTLDFSWRQFPFRAIHF